MLMLMRAKQRKADGLGRVWGIELKEKFVFTNPTK